MAKKMKPKAKQPENEQEAWERTVGKAIIQTYEEGLKRSMGREAAEDFLQEEERASDSPLANLRRKLRAS